jgi:hypothetical protein
MHNKVESQSNLVLQSLTSGPTWSPGPSFFQIDAQDASDLQFGLPTYE